MTTPSLGTMPIDLDKLMESRMLLVASSGSGKSWALRRVLEQTVTHVQQLIIDPEGEFASLREKFDYIVCAPRGADAVATPQTAAALATALWKAGTSAILDISELKAHERVLFVKRFLETLIAMPREFWHPTMVVIDEAHLFCPQTGNSESAQAVIDLATRGRKRGLCLVAATTRIAKVDKDALAELKNKLIGGMSLDVDVKRAADELGLTPRDATEKLRALTPGDFFAFGPALSPGVTVTRIGPIVTTHPKAGQGRLAAPPQPSAKVMATLAKIAGLQRDAEEEVKTVAGLSTELANVRRELTIAKKGGVPEEEVHRRIKLAVQAACDAIAKEEAKRPKAAPDPKLVKAIQDMVRIAHKAIDFAEEVGGQKFDIVVKDYKPIINPTYREAVREKHAATEDRIVASSTKLSAGVSMPQQRILDALAKLESLGLPMPQKHVVAAMAGVSPKSSGYSNNLGAMRGAGLIDYPAGGLVSLTEDGRIKADLPKRPTTLLDLHQAWHSILPNPQRAIVSALSEVFPDSFSKAALADRIGVSNTSSGYSNNLGALRTLGLLEYPASGRVKATALLFPNGANNAP